jgi:tetratricopeptide (TPR) repeat protein
MKDYDRAFAECMKGIELDPESVELHNTLGMVLLARNDPGGAVTALRKAIDLDAKFWLAWYNLGRAYGMMEQRHAALEAHIQAMNRNPRDPRVRRALARAYFRSAEAHLAEMPPDIEAARGKAQMAQRLGFPVPQEFWNAIDGRR